MKSVTVHAAKTILSQCVARAAAGEEIILSRGRVPGAKIVPWNPVGSRRQFGVLYGKPSVDAAFFEPLPDEERAGWGRS